VRVQTTEAAEPSQLSETQQPPTHPQATTPPPQTATPQPPSATPEHQHTHNPNTEEVDDHEDEEQQRDSEERHDDDEEQQGESEERHHDNEEQQRDSEDQEGSEEREQENEQKQQDDPTPPHPAPSLPPGVHPVDLAPPEQLKPFVHSVDQLFFTGIWLCSNCTHRSVRGGAVQQGGEAEFWFQRPACCANCQKAQPTSYPHPAPVVVLGPWDLILDFSQSPPVRLNEEAVKARREHIVNLAK